MQTESKSPQLEFARYWKNLFHSIKSERALIIFAPMDESVAQEGIKPHFKGTSSRPRLGSMR